MNGSVFNNFWVLSVVFWTMAEGTSGVPLSVEELQKKVLHLKNQVTQRALDIVHIKMPAKLLELSELYMVEVLSGLTNT